jgi:hypothetical protein
VAAGSYTPAEEWGFLDLRVPQESRLVGYRLAPPLPAPCYVTPEAGRRLRAGAEEEAGARGPRGPPEAEPAAAARELPAAMGAGRPPPWASALRAQDPANRPAIGRPGRCASYPPPPAAPAAATEAHAEFALRPRARAVPGWLPAAAAEVPAAAAGRLVEDALVGPVVAGRVVPEAEAAPGLGSARCLRGTPSLSRRWLPRRELPWTLCGGLPRPMTGPDATDDMVRDGRRAAGGGRAGSRGSRGLGNCVCVDPL